MDFSIDQYLLAISGLALALAGFTGLINVFRPTNEKYIPQEIEGMKLILHSSFGATLFSLLPFLTIYSLEDNIAWIACKLLLVLALLWGIYTHAQKIQKLRLKKSPARKEKGLIIFLIVTVMTIIWLILSLLNNCSHDAYLWTTTWMLVMGVLQFFVFVSAFTDQTIQDNKLNK